MSVVVVLELLKAGYLLTVLPDPIEVNELDLLQQLILVEVLVLSNEQGEDRDLFEQVVLQEGEDVVQSVVE